MLVSICLPTVRAGSIRDAIEAILHQTSDQWELIVVPQGDDQEVIDLLEAYRALDRRISFVHSDQKNLSNARNVAMRAAKGDIIAFTDDDCEVAPDWVEVLIEAYTAHPEIGYLGGEVVAPKSTRPWQISTCPSAHVVDATYLPSRDGELAPDGFYMIGANFSVRREVADRVGAFDPVLGAGARFACCEDQDFGFRAAALDTGFMTTKRLVVNHTTGRRYGLREFLKHQRNYARGRGAWVAKLGLWGHRLGQEWSTPAPFSTQLKRLFTRPDKWALERYASHHARIAAQEYTAEYELGDDLLSRPRRTSPDDVPATSAIA